MEREDAQTGNGSVIVQRGRLVEIDGGENGENRRNGWTELVNGVAELLGSPVVEGSGLD